MIKPPPATNAAPPSTLTQAKTMFSQELLQSHLLDGQMKGADDYGKGLLRLLARLSARYDMVHFLHRHEIEPPHLTDLLAALKDGYHGFHLSLCCSIENGKAYDFLDLDDGGAIVQIQWRAEGRLPDFGFFRATSRVGIWNHLVLDGPAATAANINAIARQPNIIHSWGAVSRDDGNDDADDGYGRVTPLPGRPLWQAIDDPAHRFMLIDRFGKDWLLRSRVDDDGDRLLAVGRALAYHFCPPDRLPEGQLDEICAMVAAGGTVALTHVRSNLERAFLIGYVLENGVIVGNSSLKNPRAVYIDAVRRQSGLDLAGFVERGYTSVRPEYRGLGIGTRLLEGLTARAGDRKIFSVIAEDNEATKVIARRNRTRRVATYTSEKAGKRVGIWMPEWMIDDHEKK